MILEIWTDGSSLGNPGPGGWGVVMKFNGKTKEMSGSNPNTTNNRMELTAIIEALEVVGKTNHPIQLWSDSKYCVDAINKGWVFNWAKKPGFAGKKNEDLWRRFLAVYDALDLTIGWVKGHNGHPENERCDFLATQAAKNQS